MWIVKERDWRRMYFDSLGNFLFQLDGIKNKLIVLLPSHVQSTFTENLSLHVNTILADKSHTTQTTSHTARTGTFSVVRRMCRIKLVWDTCLSHFGIICQKTKKSILLLLLVYTISHQKRRERRKRKAIHKLLAYSHCQSNRNKQNEVLSPNESNIRFFHQDIPHSFSTDDNRIIARIVCYIRVHFISINPSIDLQQTQNPSAFILVTGDHCMFSKDHHEHHIQ